MALNIKWTSATPSTAFASLGMQQRENELARADKRQENLNKAMGDLAKHAKNYKDTKERQETSDKALEHYKAIVAQYEAKEAELEALMTEDTTNTESVANKGETANANV